MKNKDDIKTFLVVISVCVICVIVALILSTKSNSDKLVVVNEYNVYFSNVSYINKYINYMSGNDSNGVYSLLDTEYTHMYNITRDNVLEFTHNYPAGSSLKVTNMEYVQIEDNFVYYINGEIYQNDYENTLLVDDDFSVLLFKDYDSLSYSLYPIDISNYKKILNKVKKVSIDRNKYNIITDSVIIDKEQICGIYLSDFINNLSYDIDYSYRLLSDSMKTIYNDINSFKNFISNNGKLFSGVADKCRIEEQDDKRVYTVIDDNENIYVFTEKNIMNYKVDFYLKKTNG